MEKSAKILICGENTEERRRLTEALIKHGYRAIADTHSAESAISMIVEGSYDLVITDLWMAGTDGIGLIRRLDVLPPERKPIFILTSPVNR